MEQGLAKGGLKHPDDARLHLGQAYLLAGKTHSAAKVFKSVQVMTGHKIWPGFGQSTARLRPDFREPGANELMFQLPMEQSPATDRRFSLWAPSRIGAPFIRLGCLAMSHCVR